MHAQKNDLPVAAELPGVFESRQAQWGGFTAAIETLHRAHDFTEVFSELPTGRCQSPHWGYVLRGKARILYADHEEVLKEGDLYFLEPGHIPVSEEECLIVEFSPPENYSQTLSTMPKH